MPKFNFKLDPALKWRSAQMKSQEALLHSLYRDFEAVEKLLENLRAEFAQTEAAARSEVMLGGSSLAALARYRQSCAKRSAELTMRLQQLGAAIEKQKAAYVHAKRDYELLTKLEGRELQNWKADTDRMVEAEASESFLLRWNRK